MINRVKDEKGAVMIVEAAIVYPIVLFVVVIFIFLGNLFYQQAKVDAIAVRTAEYLARMYTHPLLQNGSKLPTDSTQIDVQPYRYLFGSDDAKSKTEDFMNRELRKTGTGLFSEMEIRPLVTSCEIENYVVYQKITVEIEYSVNLIPLKLFGGVPIVRTKCVSAATASDPAEFIRNIDMILDYAESSGLTDKIKNTVSQFTGR